jgi:adenylate cyclase
VVPASGVAGCSCTGSLAQRPLQSPGRSPPGCCKCSLSGRAGLGRSLDADGDVQVARFGADEVVALYVPAVGADHAQKAVAAAGDLLRATADLLPVGAGVHTGVAYVGAVGSDSTVADFTALGEAVNVTSRLASLAGAGEALISEAAHAASGSDLGELDRRELSLRSRTAPLAVRVLRA